MGCGVRLPLTSCRTDQSWARSLKYLVENVVLKADITPAGG